MVFFRNDDDGSIAPWSASRQTLFTPHTSARATWASACHRWVHFFFVVTLCTKSTNVSTFQSFLAADRNKFQSALVLQLKWNQLSVWLMIVLFFRWTLFRPRWNQKVATHTEGLKAPSCNGECCFVFSGLTCTSTRHRNVASARSATPDCASAVFISKRIPVQYVRQRLTQSQRWIAA